LALLPLSHFGCKIGLEIIRRTTKKRGENAS